MSSVIPGRNSNSSRRYFASYPLQQLVNSFDACLNIEQTPIEMSDTLAGGTAVVLEAGSGVGP